MTSVKGTARPLAGLLMTALALSAVACGTNDRRTSPAPTVKRFDFQPPGGVPAPGYRAETGSAYAEDRGYGWIRQDGVGQAYPAPLDISPNGRRRRGRVDGRLASFLHLQAAGSAGPGMVTVPAAWELAVPRGRYAVTVGVGDGSYFDARNAINIEGRPAVRGFVGTPESPFKTVTRTVAVSDGKLTLDAIGGINTKLGYVTVRADRATNAEAVPSQQSGVGSEFFGVNSMGIFASRPEFVGLHVRLMSSIGLRVVRRTFDWKVTEPRPPDAAGHHYVFDFFDRMVGRLARRGMRFQPVLHDPPAWAAADPQARFSAPAEGRLEDFTAWAQALVRRYGRNGSFWRENPGVPKVPVTTYEVWNEQNGSYGWGTLTDAPEDYADLYGATREAIRRLDPAGTVVVGGLAPTRRSALYPDEFLRRMYAHRPDLAADVDAIGFHPYASTAAEVKTLIKDFRAAVDRYAGPNVPIAITETGWSAFDTSEADRVAYLRDLVEDLPRSDCNLSQLLLHTWLNAPTAPVARDRAFGIWRASGTALPAGAAVEDAIRKLPSGAGNVGTRTIRVCH